MHVVPSLALLVYTICVPQINQEACLKLLETPASTGPNIKCVTGRDRMECLEKVKARKADFMIVDPEDMYVAYRMQNEDFSVFSEIRTLVEPNSEFRYEGIMLVHKGSDIHSMKDLAGKKACYTGYGRNVGFKIPLTKLTNAGVVKYTSEAMPAPEKELKAFSEFFSKGCLVGRYSPDTEINVQLKKKYSNLCELCEDPVKCDYPDIYSGYEGAVRCVAHGRGDVAFTKVIFVNKYFGLSPNNTAQGNPEDFEYLCEDGTRKPITGPACSWAARPWQGYMGNGDTNQRATELQGILPGLYEQAKTADKKLQKKLLVDEKNLVVNKEKLVLPGSHLELSRYLDVIERSTTRQEAIKLCVDTQPALDKCNVLKMAAYSRDIRPVFECHLQSKDECIASVGSGAMDTTVLYVLDAKTAQDNNLTPVLFEQFNDNDKMVAIAPKGSTTELLRKASLDFDSSNPRATDAALLFKYNQGSSKTPECGHDNVEASASGLVKIVHAKDTKNYADMELVCPDMSTKPYSEFRSCHSDFAIPRAVVVNKNGEPSKRDDVVHAFTALSEQFGHNSPKEDVFELFAEFKKGQKDVLFDDRTEHLASLANEIPTEEAKLYLSLHCLKGNW